MGEGRDFKFSTFVDHGKSWPRIQATPQGSGHVTLLNFERLTHPVFRAGEAIYALQVW